VSVRSGLFTQRGDRSEEDQLWLGGECEAVVGDLNDEEGSGAERSQGRQGMAMAKVRACIRACACECGGGRGDGMAGHRETPVGWLSGRGRPSARGPPMSGVPLRE
jgi:hypothetical protein